MISNRSQQVVEQQQRFDDGLALHLSVQEVALLHAW